MNCLAQRKKFKNKHPVWEDPTEQKIAEPEKLINDELEEEEEGEKQQKDDDPAASSSSDDDDDYELVAGEIRSKKIKLETQVLKYKHLTNLNNDRSFNGQVSKVQFHPESKMALVTLSRGQVDLYEVDGERNRYIQNIKLPYTIKPYSLFKPDGNSIVISSDNYKGTFYTYDLVEGNVTKYATKIGSKLWDMTDFKIFGDYMACRKEGSPEVLILDSRTYENLFTLRLNEPVRAIQMTSNKDIFIAGENAKVYIWDLRKSTLCKHRFQDEGTVHATSMAITEASKMISLGSDCGVVNTYEFDSCLSNRFPTPIKTFMNLKSPIDILEYNHSGELLLMGSSQQNEGFRMVHTHSNIVYKNFPLPQKKYGRLLSANFSPLSGYLALGCSTGRAHLCRIPYYKSY